MSFEEQFIKLKEQIEINNKLIETQNEIIKSTEKALELEKKKNMYLLRKKYYEAELGDTVYLYDDNISDINSLKKLGSTENIRNRESQYNTCNQSGEIIFAKKCYNGELTESVCHHILDKFRKDKRREWFEISDKIGIEIINIVCMIMDGFIPYADKLHEHNMFSTISAVFEQITGKIEKSEKKEEYINRFDEQNKIIEERKSEVNINTQTVNPKNPLNFQQFIAERCEEDPEHFCIKAELYGSHRLWSRNTDKTTKDAIYKYCNENLISGKKYIVEHDATLAVFYGLRLKPFVLTPINHTFMTETERFISDRCKIGYTYRLNYTSIYDEFINWKKETINDFKLDSQTKSNLRNVLNTLFVPTSVFMSNNLTPELPTNTGTHGVWGMTLKNDNTKTGIKLSPALRKKVYQVDVKSKKVIDTFDSLTAASKKIGIAASTLSTIIRFEKVKDNCVFMYEDKKKK